MCAMVRPKDKKLGALEYAILREKYVEHLRLQSVSNINQSHLTLIVASYAL